MGQKKVEIFLAKFHKSLAQQFLEIAIKNYSRGLNKSCLILLFIIHLFDDIICKMRKKRMI
jgi:hypothetical protein